MRLTEEREVYIYKDIVTGKAYQYDGTKLVEIKPQKGSGSGGGGGQDDQDQNQQGQGGGGGQGDQDQGQDEQQGQGGGGGQGEQQDGQQGQGGGGNQSGQRDGQQGQGGGGKSGKSGKSDSQSSQGGGGQGARDLKHILKDVDNIADVWNQLSEEERQQIRNQVNKVDREVLKREEEEREKELEEEREEFGDDIRDGDFEGAQAHIEEIEDIRQNKEVLRSLLGEVDRKKRAEVKQAEKEKAEQNRSGLAGIEDFEFDVLELINTEVSAIIRKDWSRFNKRTEGSGIIKPGKSRFKLKTVPRLLVYYDQSGSWTVEDTQKGDRALATLDSFVDAGLLIKETYYFADYVSTTNPRGGGTGAGYELMKHIEDHEPDNVMIMTDHDIGSSYWQEIYDYEGKITVPGGVFFLFKDGQESQALIDRLEGELMTKKYQFA